MFWPVSCRTPGTRRWDMIRLLLLPVALCWILLPARADMRNKKTVVTFPEPVEVPGAILPPGKYVLKLADSPASRHIVHITDPSEGRVYATILTIPKYRSEALDQ